MAKWLALVVLAACSLRQHTKAVVSKEPAAALAQGPKGDYEKGMVADGNKAYGEISDSHAGPAYQKEAFKEGYLAEEYTHNKPLDPHSGAAALALAAMLFAQA